jgi:hypothetical protein
MTSAEILQACVVEGKASDQVSKANQVPVSRSIDDGNDATIL